MASQRRRRCGLRHGRWQPGVGLGSYPTETPATGCIFAPSHPIARPSVACPPHHASGMTPLTGTTHPRAHPPCLGTTSAWRRRGMLIARSAAAGRELHNKDGYGCGGGGDDSLGRGAGQCRRWSVREGRLCGGGDDRGGGLVMGSRDRRAGEAAWGGIVVAGVLGRHYGGVRGGASGTVTGLLRGSGK